MGFNLQVIRRMSKFLSGGGPYATPADARAIVSDIKIQGHRAPAIVGRVSGLNDAVKRIGDVSIMAVDRSEWTAGSAKSIASIFDDELPASAIGLGAVLSLIAPRILGQYDPFDRSLMVVAPNIAHFRSTYNLDRRDLCLWVSVHELTHAVQFEQAPWLRDYIGAAVKELIDNTDASHDDELKVRLQTVMSVLEGHAEYVMNNVPVALMPSRKRIIRAMAQRRSSGNLIVKKLADFTGMSAKGLQYARGADFTSAVVNKAGQNLYNRIWETAANLPSEEELLHPHLWINRMQTEDQSRNDLNCGEGEC